MDGTDGVTSSDDSQNGDSLPGGHSVLEISGPTIPSPGPSGNTYTCIVLTYTSVNTEEITGEQDFTQLREMSCCSVCFWTGRWKDYTSLGWPGPEECQRTRRVDLTTVASTWLAVSAKNIE